jgi:hypothetical protein
MQGKDMETIMMKKGIGQGDGNLIWIMDEELSTNDMNIEVYRDTTEKNGEVRVQVKKIIKKEQ